MRRVLVPLLVLSLVAAACGDSDDEPDLGAATSTTARPPKGDVDADADDDEGDQGAARPRPVLDWQESTYDGWDEAMLEVPLDHEDPDGTTMEVAVVRRPADDPDARIGPLLLNPGGPGASGIELAVISQYLFPDEVLERFDIIGFDPRGVGDSTPVSCGATEFVDEFVAIDPVPDSPEETAEAEALIQQFAANCMAESGDIVPFLDTVSTARDMDLIREALGDDQISYLGFSYGTYLGATYLELFPERVRAAVLDGAYSRSLTPVELSRGQAIGFERSLDAFLAWCRSDSCGLGDDPQATLFDTLDALDRRPMLGDDGRVLTVGLGWTGVIFAMYSEALWPSLADAIASVREQKDTSGLMSLADQYNDRSLNGSYGNSTFAFPVISCMDDPPAEPIDDAAVAAEIIAAAPRVGPVFATLPGICDHLPVVSRAPSGPFSAPNAPPVLVIATTGDPATPYEWGVTLAEELVTSSLMTVKGEGHTAYWEGNRCVDDAVDAYLVDLVVPADGTVC